MCNVPHTSRVGQRQMRNVSVAFPLLIEYDFQYEKCKLRQSKIGKSVWEWVRSHHLSLLNLCAHIDVTDIPTK